MNNNNTLVWQLKRGLLNFVEKLSDGLTRPKMKFLAQMLYGLLASQSVKLTNIGRALQEDISLKKTEDRLSRNLGVFIRETYCVQQNYLEIAKTKIDADTIFCIDPGDITKKYSRHQEGMAWIQDGSDHKTSMGWHLYGVAALTHGTKLPIPVYMKLVSPDDYMSDDQTEEILTAIRATQQTFGVCGVHTIWNMGTVPLFQNKETTSNPPTSRGVGGAHVNKRKKGRRRGMEKKTYFISYTNRTDLDKQWAVWAEWFFRVRKPFWNMGTVPLFQKHVSAKWTK